MRSQPFALFCAATSHEIFSWETIEKTVFLGVSSRQPESHTHTLKRLDTWPFWKGLHFWKVKGERSLDVLYCVYIRMRSPFKIFKSAPDFSTENPLLRFIRLISRIPSVGRKLNQLQLQHRQPYEWDLFYLKLADHPCSVNSWLEPSVGCIWPLHVFILHWLWKYFILQTSHLHGVHAVLQVTLVFIWTLPPAERPPANRLTPVHPGAFLWKRGHWVRSLLFFPYL